MSASGEQVHGGGCRRLAVVVDVWGQPGICGEGTCRDSWNHIIERVRGSDPYTLYRVLEGGVPARTVLLLSCALNIPVGRILVLLGLPESTYRRRIAAGEVLPEQAGHRAMALVRWVAKLRSLLAESGEPGQSRNFDTDGWIGKWICEPMHALGGEAPAALLRNPVGQHVVEALLERMRGGLVA